MKLTLKDLRVIRCTTLILDLNNLTKVFKQSTHQNKYGSRAFSFVGPKLWNMLPRDIQAVDNSDDFKRALKTFLMRNGEKFISMMKTT